MTERPVLVISTLANADAGLHLHHVRALHPDARLVLLAGEGTLPDLTAEADEVWREGGALGPKRFLALMRRISWMAFAVIYDLDGTAVTRFMRLCVWPRAKWVDLSL